MLEIGAISAALFGAVAYGTGDFVGSRAALRISTYGAVALAQSVGAAMVLNYLLADGARLPSGPAFSASVLAGFAYAAGVLLLYHGLAHGRIGVVAPLCGLFSIIVPLVGDLLLGEGLADWHIAGIGLCGIAVVLIASAAADDPSRCMTTSLGAGVLSGTGYGLADLWLGNVSAELAAGSLLVTRVVVVVVAGGLLAGLVLAAPARRAVPYGAALAVPMLPDRRIRLRWYGGMLLAVLAGIFDTLGQAGFMLSAQAGSVAVAAALVALFPAVSVLLAVVILKESLRRRQVVGFGVSILGVTLVTA